MDRIFSQNLRQLRRMASDAWRSPNCFQISKFVLNIILSYPESLSKYDHTKVNPLLLHLQYWFLKRSTTDWQNIVFIAFRCTYGSFGHHTGYFCLWMTTSASCALRLVEVLNHYLWTCLYSHSVWWKLLIFKTSWISFSIWKHWIEPIFVPALTTYCPALDIKPSLKHLLIESWATW